MAQQVKRDPHRPDHTSYGCPWCAGQRYKHINTTETVHCIHCKGKGRVSPEKAATYQNSFVAQRRQYTREQEEGPKPKKMNISERVRLEIEYGWNPKDNPNHSYWNK